MVKIVADNAEKVLVDPAIVYHGKDGKDGIPGPEGMPGRDGIDGRDGKDGRDGIDGKDGKDGTCYWIEYDKKTNTLVFKNDAGKKSPDPIKLPSAAKGWGFAAGSGRGGGQVQADWNQTDKNNPTYIKNKPTIHNVSFKIVEELPLVGNSWTIYLVRESEDSDRGGGSLLNNYSEWIFVEDTETHVLFWEQLGIEADLSGYVQFTDIAGAGHISNKTAENKWLSPSTIDDVAAVSARSMYDKSKSISGGTVNLDEGCVFYTDSPSVNTAYTFNTSALTQSGFNCRYFNMVIEMPSVAVTLDFTTNNNVTWIEDKVPDLSNGSRTYLLAFQTFDGGTNWIGSLCTWWLNS